MGHVAEGARWVLALAFLLAAMEKVLALRSRSAAWHPVMLVSPVRRRLANTLFSISAVADICAVVLLILAPRNGGVLAGALVFTYTVAGWSVHAGGHEEQCDCFWRVLNTYTREGLLVRNSLLIVSAILVSTGVSSQQLSGVLWGIALSALIVGSTQFVERRKRSAVAREEAIGMEP